jgi:hypothetical protein
LQYYHILISGSILCNTISNASHLQNLRNKPLATVPKDYATSDLSLDIKLRFYCISVLSTMQNWFPAKIETAMPTESQVTLIAAYRCCL